MSLRVLFSTEKIPKVPRLITPTPLKISRRLHKEFLAMIYFSYSCLILSGVLLC